MRNDWDPHPIDLCLGLLLLIAMAVACVVFFGLPAYGQQYQGPTIRDKVHVLGQMDLPIEPPVLGGQPFHVPEQRTPEPDPPADDPRDTPPPVFYGEEIDSEGDSLIYVLDASGSMRGDRWAKARDETIRSVSGLAESMRFDVVVYQGTTILTLWGECRPADEEAKAAAAAWLSVRNPGGGTPTAAAMAQALSDRANRAVVLLSDGIPNSGPGPCRRSIRVSNTHGAVIDCFGVGARGDFRAFLQGVAADSGGSYVDVP